MATHKAGKWSYTDAELEQMFVTSDLQGKESLQTEIQAQAARYDAVTHHLVIELKNGATFSIPCERLQGLSDAAPAEIAAVELGLRGASLHWEKLDLDFTVGGLVQGRFGTRQWMKKLQQADLNQQTSAASVRHRKVA